MAVKWTKEQLRVIDTRNCNILVSAAAGSGKTAVLVARILSMITDKEKPVDIDRLLVLTFTNAAAAEMRERIRDALELRAEEEPDNIHLQRQLVLIHNARITTIHSFCLNVLRNHFQIAGIDPSFRVADEGEIRLLEQEAADEIIEEAYQEKSEEFLAFLEAAATGKDDRIIGELILQLYHFALGQPWPAEWLEQCRRMYENDRGNGGKNNQDEGQKDFSQDKKEERNDCWNDEYRPDWVRYVEEDTALLLADALERLENAIQIAEEPDGPYMYVPMLRADMEMIYKIIGVEECEETLICRNRSYESYADAFRNMGSYAVLSRKKDDCVSPDKRELVKEIRGEVKEAIASIRQKYYYDRIEVLKEEFFATGIYVRALTRLVEAFMERMTEKKAEKNILDFGDLEHLALNILVERREGRAIPSAAALEYAETFEEIMTDEYQDSNLVQELILNSVAGRGKEESNRFMVGDVKQSIYRFRLARPELFMEKYKTYQMEENSSCRIDLHRNFRSRPEVLDSVNEIFRQIMTEKLGGIAYDDEVALYPGATFEEIPEELSGDIHTTELWLLESDTQSRQKKEALLVGRRIRDLVGSMPVWDKEEERYRTARYSDIVILLRTVSGWAEVFGEVLGDMGIPCFTGSQKGYFSALEIRTVLSYLQILDNPIQDIPLAAVLRSPMGGICDEELAQIRSASEKRNFYECIQEYRNKGTDSALKDKLERFFAVFDFLRTKCGHTPVHLLIWELLDVTGYGEYAAALPGGSQRKANLDMLVEKAMAYETTSYRGLYHFIRYIEQLKKYEVDYGEANEGLEAEDTVRIMSIHKSKGLEFPVVFVCGMGKQFNEADSWSKVVAHPEFGIGCDFVDTQMRIREATLLKKVIQKKTIQENLGEELRVLYVAMTRAKEKLILTGNVSDLERTMNKWNSAAGTRGETLSYSWLSSASTYLDWVVPGIFRSSRKELFVLEKVNAEELDWEKQQEELLESVRLAELLNYDSSVCRNRELRNQLERVFEDTYAYEAERDIIGKLSVSELKKLSHMSEETDAAELYQTEVVVPLIPQFREVQETLSGAARGTVYHSFMENLDYSRKDGLELQLEEMISCGKMSREESRVLKLSDIRRFLDADCGKRMAAAAENGWLYREHPFVLGVPASEIRKDWNGDETVLVQGIIDAYFKEADGTISILDYKTDHVEHPQMLVDRYRTQLDYYAMALERLTGYKVKDRIIYSFHLGREITIPV